MHLLVLSETTPSLVSILAYAILLSVCLVLDRGNKGVTENQSSNTPYTRSNGP